MTREEYERIDKSSLNWEIIINTKIPSINSLNRELRDEEYAELMIFLIEDKMIHDALDVASLSPENARKENLSIMLKIYLNWKDDDQVMRILRELKFEIDANDVIKVIDHSIAAGNLYVARTIANKHNIFLTLDQKIEATYALVHHVNTKVDQLLNQDKYKQDLAKG